MAIKSRNLVCLLRMRIYIPLDLLFKLREVNKENSNFTLSMMIFGSILSIYYDLSTNFAKISNLVSEETVCCIGGKVKQ